MGDRLRKSLAFDGHHEKRQKPRKFNEELLDQLENVKDVRPGKHPRNFKKGSGKVRMKPNYLAKSLDCLSCHIG